MNKIFCVSCGHKNIYEATKPKFCSKCGQPVDGVGIAQANSQTIESEESIDVTNINLDKLRQSIVIEKKQPLKIEEVMGTAEGNERPIKRRPSNLPDGKDIFLANQKDVAPSKGFKDIDER